MSWPAHDPGTDDLLLAGPMFKGPLQDIFLAGAGLGGVPQIAVDSGIRYAKRPFLWAGDGDSGAIPKDIPAMVKTDQNLTDFRFCLDGIRAWKWKRLHLAGFIGGRRDHELANYGEACAEMKRRPQSARAVFYDETLKPHVTFFPAGEHRFSRNGLFSVIVFEPSEITLEGGCRYAAEKLPLEPLSGRGVSNVGTGEISARCPTPFAVVFAQHD